MSNLVLPGARGLALPGPASGVPGPGLWDGSQTSLLDTYGSPAFARSLRALSSAYTGPLIEVDDGTSQQDIYALADGSLDTASLLAFAGSNTVRVRTWYDQSGNGRDIERTTHDAAQPMIVNAGSLVTSGGMAAMLRTYNDANYPVPVLSFSFAGTMSLFQVTQFDGTNNTIVWAAHHNNGFAYVKQTSGSPNLIGCSAAANPRLNNGATTNNWANRADVHTDLNGVRGLVEIYLNGFGVTWNADDEPLSNNSSYSTFRGADYWQEQVGWNNDQTSNQAGIASDMNTYWGVY